MAEADDVLLDSLVAERSNGTLIVGRGVPAEWLETSDSLSVSNFPTTGGGRMSFTVSWHGTSVSLEMTGHLPGGSTLFQLPAFLGNIERASSGTVDEGAGTVSLPPRARRVTVELRRVGGEG